MNETERIIRKITDFIGVFLNKEIYLNVVSLTQLSEILEYKKFEKGSFICKEGEIDRYIYYVYKGLIRQYYFKKNKDVTEHFAVDNEMFMCIESFFRTEPTSLIVEALEPTELYCISHDRIEKLCNENVEVQFFYRSMLESSLIMSQRKADMIRYETAQERYNLLLKNQPEVIKRAPLQYIASYLLMTPESLSRVRAGRL